MMISRRRVLSLGGALAGLAALQLRGPALAAGPAPARLSEADRDAILRIEQYFNGIQTVQARFIQVASDGSYAEGNLKLQRPGKLRIDYDPPSQVLIQTAGDWLIYWDRSNGQITRLPVNSTPAGLLVREHLAVFSKELTVVRFVRKSGLLELTLVRTENAGEGSLTLVFNDNPIALRQWIVTDAQGISTTVTLADARFGVTFDPEVFRFRDPSIFGSSPP